MSTVSAKDLAVTEVVVTPVAFPDPPLLNFIGVHQPWAIRTIVEVRTDSGLVGLGESYADEDFLALVRRSAPAVVGLSPFDINGLQTAIGGVVGGLDTPDAHGLTGPSSGPKSLARVVSPFEVAFWDLQGQATGLPVHALLGGKVRDEVPFSAYLFYKWAGHPGAEPDEWGEALDPEGMVRQARMMVDRYGFQSLKFKGGVFEPDKEIETARALAEAFPDLPLRVDPNAAWSVPTSIRVGKALEGTLEYLEDPTPGRVGMAEVAREVSMPLATNMCTVAFNQIPESVELGSVGVILSDHHYWGGLRASAQLAAICHTFGIGLSMHSNSHLGISLAAMTHLAAATPNLTYACDTHTPWNPQDVVAEPWSIVGGAVRVPDAPGLGITLDRDALARLHEQYVKSGITKRDDTGYMQQFQPDFAARSAAW
jgi:glucarate dehydratase